MSEYFPLVEGLVREYRRTASGATSTVRFEVVSVSKDGGGIVARCRISSDEPGRQGRPPDEFDASLRPDGAYFADQLLLPLPLKVGRRWTADSDDLTLASLSAAVRVPAGAFKRCARVDYLIGGGDCGSGVILYAPGVGPVYEDRRDEASPYLLELTAFRLPGAGGPAPSLKGRARRTAKPAGRGSRPAAKKGRS